MQLQTLHAGVLAPCMHIRHATVCAALTRTYAMYCAALVLRLHAQQAHPTLCRHAYALHTYASGLLRHNNCVFASLKAAGQGTV
jgi:hypothetical protein